MTRVPEPSPVPLRIQSPCPKRWEELFGAGSRRFCSECKLHVHDATQLTSTEARALVADATARVCMKMEYDASGAPVFRDSATRKGEEGRVMRAARWAMTAAAGVLAACQGGSSTASSSTPSSPAGVAPTTTAMGKIAAPQLGGVEVPPPPRIEMLGEAVAIDPPPAPPDER
jgi:hypothetical protein